MCNLLPPFLKGFCLMNAAYNLSVYRPCWERMLIEKNWKNVAPPATTVICILLFIGLGINQFFKCMQHRQHQVMRQ